MMYSIAEVVATWGGDVRRTDGRAGGRWHPKEIRFAQYQFLPSDSPSMNHCMNELRNETKRAISAPRPAGVEQVKSAINRLIRPV